MEIVAANLKEKKVTLRMTAMPKEWKTGDTSLQFYLSCDGGEKIAVDAAAGADHSFTAEKETHCKQDITSKNQIFFPSSQSIVSRYDLKENP